jgi:hypothetical protein
MNDGLGGVGYDGNEGEGYMSGDYWTGNDGCYEGYGYGGNSYRAGYDWGAYGGRGHGFTGTGSNSK